MEGFVLLLRRAAPLLAVAVVLLAGSASADPASELGAAESRTVNAEADTAAAQVRLDSARADYTAASRRARPLATAVRTAQTEARELTAELTERRQQARAEIVETRASHRQAEEDRDDEVTTGLGIGLALLVAAAITLAWGRFRSSPVVAALVRMQLGQAVALCVGGGFLVLVIGAALAAGDGFVAVLGTFLASLSLILPLALLLARHSNEVESGRSKPIFGRWRMPDRLPPALAGLLLLLGLIGLLSPVTTEDPPAPSISAQQRAEAEPIASGPGAERLEDARAKAVEARQQATGPLSRQSATRSALQKATSAVRQTKVRLVEAEADVRRSERRLAAFVAREEREAARQAEREAEEAEEIEAIEEEENEIFEEEEEAASGCDPNYSGCVPAYPPDVDCAEVGGSVSVYGSDPHGLDADGDGVGCE